MKTIKKSLLPVRGIVEVMGGIVDWNAGEQKVTIYKEDTIPEFWINQSTMKVDGEEKVMEKLSNTSSLICPILISLPSTLFTK